MAETALLASIEKHARISSEQNPARPELTDCKMHMKVIVSRADGADEGRKLHMTAAARGIAVRGESYQMTSLA